MIDAARLRGYLRTLYQSTTLRATLIFGFAGVAHMLGNLLLARQLSPFEFAGVALFLAFTQVGTSLGMVGAETIIVRHGLGPTMRLLGTVVLAACSVAIVLAAVGHLGYDMSVWLVAVTFAAVVASAVMRVDAAFYQSRQKFRMSLFLHQSYNFALLAAGLLALWLGFSGAVVPCALMTAGIVAMAIWGWRSAVRSYAGTQAAALPYPWREAWSIVGFAAAGVLTLQAERLLIPPLLSAELLATYAVLAALAGSPFQMLMVGVGYTMMPRLKNSGSLQQRRRIVRNELWLVALTALVAAVFVLLLASWLAELITAGKYTLSLGLVATAVFTGAMKVINGFLAAVLRALGAPRDLQRLNRSAWIGLVLTVLAAVPAARYGLEGLLAAVGFGWLVRSILVTPAALASLSLRTSQAG